MWLTGSWIIKNCFWFGVITLFPEMFDVLKTQGVIATRAIRHSQIEIRCFNPRDHAPDRHKTVDDRPYGGGPGMVMKIEPLMETLVAAKESAFAFFTGCGVQVKPKVVLLTPQGQPLRQAHLQNLADQLQQGQKADLIEPIILVAGRYEGIDERFVELAVDLEYSIGDYVLTGGELPAMVFLDALIRLLPGVLGSSASVEEESFNHNLLDHPHYTRPPLYQGLAVPEVLLSGNHQAIQSWRAQERKRRTALRRPDLNL